jgi:hypothetical protein
MAETAVAPATSQVSHRSAGRALFWLGIGVSLLGIPLSMLQISLKQLFTPWYVPALTTLGVLLLAWSMARRRTVVRGVALVLFALLAGFGWYMLGWLAKLPEYTGPARPGAKLPAFETTLADGRAFTEKDLETGVPTVLTFFRGRW